MEDAAKRIVSHYERHALSWDADRRAAVWIDKPCIERFLDFLPRDATVLDLGCGGGSPVARHMVAHGFRITGVDSSPTLISLCRARMPDQEWIVGDMRSLALGRRFQGILAWDSFFHLCHDDQQTMFEIFALHAAPATI
jgi:trans-aconitate methyltransferase